MDERRLLDKKLAKVLNSLENSWLGGWKGMLLGEPTDEDFLAVVSEKQEQVQEFLLQEGFRKELFQDENDGRVLLTAVLRAASTRSLTKKQVIEAFDLGFLWILISSLCTYLCFCDIVG